MAKGVAPVSAPSLATLLNTAPDVAAVADAAEPQTEKPHDTDEPHVATAETATAEPHEEHPSNLDREHAGIASESDAAHPEENVTAIDPPIVDTPPVEAAAAAQTASLPARKATGPRFLHQPRTTPVHARRARWLWTTVAGLGLLLCVQVVLADRARLATQAGWRPVVVALCGVFRCDVPTWREPAAFAMLSRDVRPLPGMPGTLQAQATFRNEARWPQAWPVILLTLKDADGRTLGARALQPTDYLPAEEALTVIEPGQSAQMAIRIREPSASVVAFSFDFR